MKTTNELLTAYLLENGLLNEGWQVTKGYLVDNIIIVSIKKIGFTNTSNHYIPLLDYLTFLFNHQ